MCHIYLCCTFDFKQELLSMGDMMEVLEPASLRAEIERIGKMMVEKHKKNRLK